MDRKEEVLKLENQLCFPLYAAARTVVNHYHPLLKELDLTYTQYIAMMVFWEQETCSAKELGEKLFLDSGTLTPVLKSLEAKGLVRRYRSREDERVLVAEITPAGRALKQKALAVPPQVAACIPLQPDEAAVLYRLLYKVLAGTADE